MPNHRSPDNRYMFPFCRLIMRILIPLLLWLAASSHASAQAIIDAVKRNDLAAVQRLLMENPRNVAAMDGGGSTPLHWAANQGNLQIMKLLLAYRADVNLQQSEGFTPLHSATVGNKDYAMELLL